MGKLDDNIQKIEELIHLIDEEVRNSVENKEVSKTLGELSKSVSSVKKMMVDKDKSISEKGNEIFESIKDIQLQNLEKIKELKNKVELCDEKILHSRTNLIDRDKQVLFEKAKKVFDSYDSDLSKYEKIIDELNAKKEKFGLTQEEEDRLTKAKGGQTKTWKNRKNETYKLLPGSRSEKDAYFNQFKAQRNAQKKLKEGLDEINESLREQHATQGEITEELRKTNTELDKTKKTAGRIRGIFKGVLDLAKECGNEWMKYDKIATEQGRNWGITREEVAKYRKSLLGISHDLADEYGMTREEITKIQDDYVRATGRLMLMGKEQTENSIAAGKLVTTETVNAAIKTMDAFGSSTDRTNMALYSTYEKSAALGLDAKETASAFAKNMSLASRYTFSKGVDGIQKMTLLSQRLKFNMDEIAKAAGSFETISDAIKNSAQLQMLGGTYALNFGNPVEAMYEAMNDMESFTKRVTDMWGGKGVFNEKTGMVDIGALDKRMIRESAKAIGISESEALTIAQRKTVEEKVNSEINRSAFSSMSETERSAIIARAQWDDEKRKHYVTYMNRDGSTAKRYVDEMDKGAVSEIMNSTTVDDINKNVYNISGDLKSIKDTMQKRAKSMVSLSEQIEGSETSIRGGMAKAVESPMGWAKDKFKDIVDGDSWMSGIYDNLIKPDKWYTVLAKAGILAFGSIGLKSTMNFITTRLARGWINVERSINSGTNRIVSAIKTSSIGGGPGGPGASGKSFGKLDVYKRWLGVNKGSILAKAGIGAGIAIGGALLSHYGDKKRDNGEYGGAQNAMSIGGSALAGAGIGMTVGSVIPVVGSAGGAIVGGTIGTIYGLYEDSKYKKKLGDNSFVASGKKPDETENANAITKENVERANDRLASIDATLGNIERSVANGMEVENGAKPKYSERQTNVNSINEKFEKQMSMTNNILSKAANGDVTVSNSTNSVSVSTITPSPIANTPSAVSPTTSSSNYGGEIKVDDINVNVNGTLKLDAGGHKIDFDIAEKLRNDKVLMEKVVSIITDELGKRKRYGSV